MSYFEDVYLARLNQDGTTRQDRILGAKERQFEAFLQKSIYKVDFSYNSVSYEGSLQPAKGDEKDIVSYMLVPKDTTLVTGAILAVTTRSGLIQNWLITYCDNNDTYGYNRYKVYLLDRVLTWWDSDKVEHTTLVNIASSKDASVTDVFNKLNGGPVYREAQNYVNLIMAYDSNLKQDVYCLLDGSPRAFIVTGFDCETVSGVQYVTLDITAVRDEESQSTTPSSFWR
ncbi:MAG: hypothetical protein PHQ86_07655 [Dehalococcoidales bacterium]|nr:hypothetical protein [Dehalococcoidales bacterium]